MLRKFIFAGTIATAIYLPVVTPVNSAPLSDEVVDELSRDIAFSRLSNIQRSLDQLVNRGKTDVVAAMIIGLRYSRYQAQISTAISALTGAKIRDWREAMLWQQANPDVVPHISYRDIKFTLLRVIDLKFMRFLGGKRSNRKSMKIRLEEISWGGVKVDGIPALDDPKRIPANEADYLLDSDLVFGVKINGDARAYPLRIMGWHEMFNDTIGGVPVALAYCTLCGAGILFETKLPDREEPFVFGSSGFLYRSNKLMFDRETDSLWNQFTGEPVSGPLVNSGITLKIRPVVITSWGKWKAQHPNTDVLSLDTGHQRNYSSGFVYKEYFASPNLMFPAIVRSEKHVKRKDYVFGIRDVGAAKAWPLAAFSKQPVINDSVGNRSVVLIGDTKTRTVRAYERNDLQFSASNELGSIVGPNGTWKITESALVGPKGQKLARVPGHISFWFAWDGYLGVDSALYKIPR
ncbi:MAG: hypothetical protein CMM52_10615 [Rhodospirillaceae bacterium]|mgnify:CR=1 FL=1|nr:hypothetical protein [Rhodospirillaceae bacterium]|tara:strand:+ start:6102 stop:7487 length:1386 start_codon:yes stop_codon:yes gene_type:complete